MVPQLVPWLVLQRALQWVLQLVLQLVLQPKLEPMLQLVLPLVLQLVPQLMPELVLQLQLVRGHLVVHSDTKGLGQELLNPAPHPPTSYSRCVSETHGPRPALPGPQTLEELGAACYVVGLESAHHS